MTETTIVDIENFFDELCAEFVHEHMTKYVNTALLREDFVRETKKAIAKLVKLRECGKESEIFEVCMGIPFWFNSFEPCDSTDDAESRIYNFVDHAAGGPDSSESDSEKYTDESGSEDVDVDEERDSDEEDVIRAGPCSCSESITCANCCDCSEKGMCANCIEREAQ